MSIDLFLKIEDIEGEAKDANHKGWITLTGFNWGVSQPGNMQTGGGAEIAAGWNIKENKEM